MIQLSQMGEESQAKKRRNTQSVVKEGEKRSDLQLKQPKGLGKAGREPIEKS